jgi:hypothetical protein
MLVVEYLTDHNYLVKHQSRIQYSNWIEKKGSLL